MFVHRIRTLSLHTAWMSAFLLGGCAVVSTGSLEDMLASGQRFEGVYYSLPVGVVTYKLGVIDGKPDFAVAVSDVSYVPDPRYRFLLHYKPSAASDDMLTVQYGSRGFLSSVKADVTDQTGAILVSLAGALNIPRGLEASSLASGSLVLAEITVDPTQPGQINNVNRVFNERIDSYLRVYQSKCVKFRKDQATKDKQALAAAQAQQAQALAKTPPKPAPVATAGVTESATLEAAAVPKSVGGQPAAPPVVVAPTGSPPKTPAAKPTVTSDPPGSQPTTPATNPPAKPNQATTPPQPPKAPDTPAAPASAITADVCDAFDQVAAEHRSTGLFHLKVESPGGEFANYPQAAPAPQSWDGRNEPLCSKGLCYRPLETYAISYGLGSSRAYSDIIALPNRSPLIEIDVTRAFMVQKVTEITFDDNGLLSKVSINKKSELLAVANLPNAIATAAITVPKDLFTLRSAAVSSQTTLANDQASLINAQAALRKARGESANLTANGAVVTGRNIAGLGSSSTGGPPVVTTINLPPQQVTPQVTQPLPENPLDKP